MQKKIGILTFHRAHNYGAVLQAYALQTYLTNLGHKVEIIDYIQESIEEDYRLIRKFQIKKDNAKYPSFLRWFKHYIFFIPLRLFTLHRRYKFFNAFIANRLNLSGQQYTKANIRSIVLDYDKYVVYTQNWRL